MLGVILSVGSAQGLILGDDGVRYTFTPLGWSDDSVSPQSGMRVTFEPRGSQAGGIRPLPGAVYGHQPESGGLAAQQPQAHPAKPSAPQTVPNSGPDASGSSASNGALSLPSKILEQLSRVRFPARLPVEMKRWHWAAMGGAAVALGIVLAVLLGIIPIFGPPMGRELAQVHYDGESYVLVEYGNDLAIFGENGLPVGDQHIALGVMSAYAWQQEFRSLDIQALSDSVRKAETVNDSLSNLRSLTNNVIDIFDTLDSLSVDIPFIGRVSALDVVRESYQGLSEGERLIRDLASELNDLGNAGDALAAASKRIDELGTSQASADQIRSTLEYALLAAQDMIPSARTAKERVSEVQEVAAEFESGLLESSDTPIIGEALGDFAETVSRFRSRLSTLSGLLGDIETDLASVAEQLQSAIDSAERASQDYMDKWMQEPHDSEWPPVDPERHPAG